MMLKKIEAMEERGESREKLNAVIDEVNELRAVVTRQQAALDNVLGLTKLLGEMIKGLADKVL